MIADQLGVSKSAIYHHVSSKEELLSAALDRALDALEAVLVDDADANGTGDQVQRLEGVIRDMVHVLVADLDAVTLLLRLRGNTPLERRALARRRAFDHAVIDIVRSAQAERRIRADIDAGTATRLVFGMVNWLTEWYRPGGSLTADALADRILAIVFTGMLPQPSGMDADVTPSDTDRY